MPETLNLEPQMRFLGDMYSAPFVATRARCIQAKKWIRRYISQLTPGAYGYTETISLSPHARDLCDRSTVVYEQMIDERNLLAMADALQNKYFIL